VKISCQRDATLQRKNTTVAEQYFLSNHKQLMPKYMYQQCPPVNICLNTEETKVINFSNIDVYDDLLVVSCSLR